MALSGILSIAGFIFVLLDKLTFIALSFYFGNLAFKGWKGRKNLILRITVTIFVGFVCFFGGLIIKDLIGWDFFLSDYISSIIVAVICYLLLWLISSGFKVKEKYATKMDVISLTKDVKKLKIQVAKLTKALEDKDMMPAPLDEESIRKALKNALEKKGEKIVEIESMSKMEDSWSCVVKTSKGKKEVIVDAYTGGLTQTKIITHPLEFLYKKPLSTIGIILMVGFLVFLGMNVSLTTIEAFNQAFDFSFLFTKPLPEGCLQASEVLENFKENQVGFNANTTLMGNVLSLEMPGYHLIPGKQSAISINGELYNIATMYNSPVSNLGSEITVSDWDNIYNVRVCVFKQDYDLCECIGGEKTDPVFTVPYLIEMGLIEEALQNIILESVTGMLSGGGSGLFGQ